MEYDSKDLGLVGYFFESLFWINTAFINNLLRKCTWCHRNVWSPYFLKEFDTITDSIWINTNSTHRYTWNTVAQLRGKKQKEFAWGTCVFGTSIRIFCGLLSSESHFSFSLSLLYKAHIRHRDKNAALLSNHYAQYATWTSMDSHLCCPYS